mgnify:CR=1 FL=1
MAKISGAAYADDAAFKTTLVEGKVRVELLDPEEHISASTLLEPDQQATYVRGSEELARTDVSASGYVSWMQGKLEFHNEALDVVMRKLALYPMIVPKLLTRNPAVKLKPI